MSVKLRSIRFRLIRLGFATAFVALAAALAPAPAAAGSGPATELGRALRPHTEKPCATEAVPGTRSAESGIRGPIPTSETLGEQRTLITLLNFTHDPSTPHTVADAFSAILDPANPVSTANYVAEASYGRAWLTGDVIDWVSVPWDDTDCFVNNPAYQDFYAVPALDPLVDFSAYDRWIIVAPFNAACGFAGYSTIGKIPTETDDGTVQLSRIVLNGLFGNDNLLAAHELGHSFGLLHALDYECGSDVVRDKCTSGFTSIRSRYEVLGDTYLGGSFSAPQKAALGWLDGEIEEVPAPGGSYSLLPYTAAGPGTKALRIPVTYQTQDLARSMYYYVSYRTDDGLDSGFPELATDGAMLHLDSAFYADEAPGLRWLLDASPNANVDDADQAADSSDVLLKVGETYTDSEKGISISVLGVTAGSLDVSVTISQYCGNGQIDPAIGEECDAALLGGESCPSLGHLGGTLQCGSDCRFDRSTCGLALCADGDNYNGDQTCTADIGVDRADLGLWRNGTDFTAIRESVWANNIFENSWLSMLVSKRESDGYMWIYRLVLPFDTAGLPDDISILSAHLAMKVVQSGGLTNTHPESADDLILVEANIANAPQAERSDFGPMTVLNSPPEGAPRIDVSEEIPGVGHIVDWPLNPTGIGWIDPQDWTVLGIRAGFDVDDVMPADPSMRFHVQFRSSDSPAEGPRLRIVYEAAAIPQSGPAGYAPDGASVAGTPLTADKNADGTVQWSWGDSCAGADSDFAVYEGTLGAFASHLPRICSTGGATTAAVDPLAGDRYFLIVPQSADREGGYGFDSAGVDRTPSAGGCMPQELGVCDTP